MESDIGISDKKLEANRANALKSTGPRSIEGKAKSAMNALKHGLTSEALILPNEDAEAYEALLQQWLNAYQPAGPAERAMIDLAVQNIWRLDRANRYERAQTAHRVRHAAATFDCDEKIRAEEIGRRLLHDPVNRCATPGKDPRTLDMVDDWIKNDDPPVLRQELFKSVTGVDWLLWQWSELYGHVNRTGFWHYNDKFRAIRLMGKRPQDVLDDFEIGMIFAVCHAAHPEPWTLWNECHQARLGIEGKPMWEGRVAYLKGFKMAHPEGAAGEIKDIVARETKKLNARRAELEPIHARDRAEAGERAMLDNSPAGAALQRYRAGYERTLQRSIAQLMKLRKESAAAGEERVAVVAGETPETSLPKSPESPESPPQPSGRETPPELTGPQRNEAKWTRRPIHREVPNLTYPGDPPPSIDAG